ncbi:hypothetical protein EWW49_31205, partial [Pseudomonas syringae]
PTVAVSLFCLYLLMIRRPPGSTLVPSPTLFRSSALEYAERLADLAAQVSDQMLLVMRAYVEKPRTTVGWRGLAYDPRLDGSDDMAEGLTLSRHLMRDMLGLGLPIATEILQPMPAGDFDAPLSWVARGSRTTAHQTSPGRATGRAQAGVPTARSPGG